MSKEYRRAGARHVQETTGERRKSARARESVRVEKEKLSFLSYL